MAALGSSARISRGVKTDAGLKADLAQTLTDCFSGKTSATLLGPVMRHVKFAKAAGLCFSCDRECLRLHLDQCQTAATFGRSFLESLNFAVHVLGLDLHVNIQWQDAGCCQSQIP